MTNDFLKEQRKMFREQRLQERDQRKADEEAKKEAKLDLQENYWGYRDKVTKVISVDVVRELILAECSIDDIALYFNITTDDVKKFVWDKCGRSFEQYKAKVLIDRKVRLVVDATNEAKNRPNVMIFLLNNWLPSTEETRGVDRIEALREEMQRWVNDNPDEK